MKPQANGINSMGRLCAYDEIPEQSSSYGLIPEEHGLNSPRTSILNATFGVALQREVRSFLGTPDEMRRTSNAYFSSIHYRLPIISEPRFHKNFPRLFTPSGIDFTTLCLCMKLIHTSPSQQAVGETDAKSQHYLLAKSSIGLLEAAGFVTLDTLQSRLLLILYEVGHGIYPAASVSIGSCARLARHVGLSRDFWHAQKAAVTTADAEERRRTWWAIHNLDRFIALYGGDAILASEDAKPDTYLPSDTEQLPCIVTSETITPTVSTPAPFRVGPFARECQVAHLMGRVVQHIYHPVADLEFRSRERFQLESTLKAFLPILIEEELEFSSYCGALGMCISSLYALYIAPTAHFNENSDGDIHNLETISTQMTGLSQHLLKSAGNEDTLTMMSLLIPYALYQTAAIQLNLYQKSRNFAFKANAELIIEILTCMGKRWRAAVKYLEALESDSPPVTLPPQGFYLGYSILDEDVANL
ncbi:fungal-specific transcription factor domain-containing protein [Trichoderma sp. SZMC 28014]